MHLYSRVISLAHQIDYSIAIFLLAHSYNLPDIAMYSTHQKVLLHSLMDCTIAPYILALGSSLFS